MTISVMFLTDAPPVYLCRPEPLVFGECRLAFEVPISRKDENTSTKGDSLARIYLDLERACDFSVDAEVRN